MEKLSCILAEIAVIPKVRQLLRSIAGELFQPHTVGIGPYHQDAGSWIQTEEKKRVVQSLQQRGFDLSALQRILDGVQSRARGYYIHLPDEDHGMDSEKFCSMLLHDGCYLLSLFINFQYEELAVSDNSYMEAVVITADGTVLRDVLYLLENQIPLFVMDEILNYLGAQGEERSALMCLSKPVEMHLQNQLYIGQTAREASSTTHHLLDLVYFYFTASEPWTTSSTLLPPYRDVAWGGHPTGQWRRATEYRRYADLGFKPRAFGAYEEWTILAVQLVGGILSIPLLRVDSYTWTLLRNLMALEEHKEARPVTSYCRFMSQLCCTTKDVKLLRSAKVIENLLSSDELVAQGFAGLCHGVALDIDRLDRNYLKPMWHAMEKRYSARANNIKGFFR